VVKSARDAFETRCRANAVETERPEAGAGETCLGRSHIEADLAGAHEVTPLAIRG
jgi:hypothetical protein